MHYELSMNCKLPRTVFKTLTAILLGVVISSCLTIYAYGETPEEGRARIAAIEADLTQRLSQSTLGLSAKQIQELKSEYQTQLGELDQLKRRYQAIAPIENSAVKTSAAKIQDSELTKMPFYAFSPEPLNIEAVLNGFTGTPETALKSLDSYYKFVYQNEKHLPTANETTKLVAALNTGIEKGNFLTAPSMMAVLQFIDDSYETVREIKDSFFPSVNYLENTDTRSLLHSDLRDLQAKAFQKWVEVSSDKETVFKVIAANLHNELHVPGLIRPFRMPGIVNSNYILSLLQKKKMVSNANELIHIVKSLRVYHLSTSQVEPYASKLSLEQFKLISDHSNFEAQSYLIKKMIDRKVLVSPQEITFRLYDLHSNVENRKSYLSTLKKKLNAPYKEEPRETTLKTLDGVEKEILEKTKVLQWFGHNYSSIVKNASAQEKSAFKKYTYTGLLNGFTPALVAKPKVFSEGTKSCLGIF